VGAGPEPGTFKEQRAALLADTGVTGRALSAALTGITDAWLAEIFAGAIGPDRDLPPGLALMAVGGYGRGELAPGSDLDVWLLHAGTLPEAELAALAERLWYPVWDAGLKLGHAVRTPRQALSLAATDLDTATALLTARSLAGDAATVAALADRALAQWRKRSKRWLAELSARNHERHRRAGEVAFLLEPDLKEGQGGLRDVHVLHWAEAARRVLLEGDDEALASAYRVILDARVELHRVTGKASDQLLLERQDEVASALGVPDADALMASLAAAARTIAWTSEEAWARIDSSLTGPLGRVLRRDRELGGGLVWREGEVHLHAGADPAGDPSLVLRAAAAAARREGRIHRAALDRLAAEAPALDGPWPGEARDALVDLLGAGRPAVAVLEALDQRRLLERVLPEWAPVRSRPQRNAYHRFTVDRHLCEAAVGAAALTGRVARPDLLLVGAWLHDIGKGYPGDHTEVGIDLMAVIAGRMGFPDEDVEVLVDLVRHHLLLPDVATRRDLDDPTVVEGVAEAVGSLGTLQLLAALTEADSLATGPSAWGRWKAGLVDKLVERTAHVLRGGGTGALAGADFPGAALLEVMARGETRVTGTGVTCTVVAPDRPGTFSTAAGALALAGLDVVAARAGSHDAMAASVFEVEPRYAGGIDWEQVEGGVLAALADPTRLTARLDDPGLRRRTPKAAEPVRPHVHVDNHVSADATVVEVRAADSTGLLHRVTRAIAEAGLDIRLARVQTLGHAVVDTFYVMPAGTGPGPVTDPEQLVDLERRLHAALADGGG
jgi:[protein-PII] uridylyltransferase